MFPLFETICIENNEIIDIAWHQQRYENSLQRFYEKANVRVFDLLKTLKNNTALSAMAARHSLIRCRMDYNAEQIRIQCFPYQRKIYRSFKPVICDHIDYSLKYSDRSLLNRLVEQRGECDEIMIIKNGKVTDCSIGNLIFRQGKQWVTPDTPLLHGTQRAKLLQQGKIIEQSILLEDITKFDEIRLINAMNGL
ncbi:aminotransferase class IV family protein [Pasteurellaceae bacterium LIM206]|nr:aminotransferase class IV family protein [Pasteurellaceae bacterium LIM206]